MSSKEVSLAVARFLDSPQANPAQRREERRIAEAFFEACFGVLGKKPRLLEEHDLLELFGSLLPGSFPAKDSAAPCAPEVLMALLRHIEAEEVVPHAYEWRRCEDELLQRFREGQGSAPRVVRRQESPVVHRADKLGRNDPCFCGSGRKFKKCCGKATS